MIKQTKLSISDAQAEANYHIGAMQSRYDTFKEEAQYLVAAQKLRLIDLEYNISQCNLLIEKILNTEFKEIESGAFFSVKSSTKRKYYFIIPIGGGKFEKINGVDALCVNVNAPIVKKYLGLKEGDELDDENEEFIEKIS